MILRAPRQTGSYGKADYTKPINIDKVMSHDTKKYEDSCFGKEWSPDDKDCARCSDMEMCGLVFHDNVKKLVKKFEDNEPVTMLDKTDFDGIDVNALILLVRTKPRKFSDFINYVMKLSNCSDRETVKYWCKSFILDNEQLKAEKGTVYFTTKN